MTPFEFLLVLYAVLAGLGLTLLVRSVGQIIETRSQVRLYWIHTAWLGFIFVVHLTSWFAFWRFRVVDDWTVAKFLLVISIPTLLYLVSHICVPEVLDDGREYDMREYFYQRHRVLMGLLAMAVVLMLVSEWLLLGAQDRPALVYARGFGLALVLMGSLSDNPLVQAVIVFLIFAMLVFGLAVLNWPL